MDSDLPMTGGGPDNGIDMPIQYVTVGQVLTTPDTRVAGEPVQVKVLGMVFNPDFGYDVVAEIVGPNNSVVDFCSYLVLEHAAISVSVQPDEHAPEGSPGRELWEHMRDSYSPEEEDS